MYKDLAGEIFLPEKYEKYVGHRALKLFSPDVSVEQVGDHLRKGGAALFSGPWKEIQRIYKAVDRIKKELVEREYLKNPNPYIRNKGFKSIENSILLMVHEDTVEIDPPVRIPALLNLCGEMADGKKETGYLIPVVDFLKITKALENRVYVDVLKRGLFSHHNVLAPRSQETNNLIAASLRQLQEDLPENPVILDMGCGSGVIVFMAATFFPGARIYATDTLPEAVGTTLVNLAALQEAGLPGLEAVTVTGGGDLFEPLPPDVQYDLIAFNAPWINVQAKSPAEKALNDEGRKTLARFFEGSGKRLKPGGRVVLCYSDHSPEGESLEELISRCGFKVEALLKDKIQTRMKGQKRVRILVYILSRVEGNI